MRREQLTDSNTPTGDELIFDAPLTQGDLTDHISGSVATYGSNPNGSVVWDSTQNAYHFTKAKNSYGQACMFSGLNLPIETSGNKVITPLRVE